MKFRTLLNLLPVLILILALLGWLVTPLTVQAVGSGVFVDSGQSLGNQYTMATALGDVDGDGDLDAFVANGDGANKVWLNDGMGTFNDSGQSLGSSGSSGAALGDVDGDGDLDAFVANGDGANKVWLNDGMGIFSDLNSGQQAEKPWCQGNIVSGKLD